MYCTYLGQCTVPTDDDTVFPVFRRQFRHAQISGASEGDQEENRFQRCQHFLLQQGSGIQQCSQVPVLNCALVSCFLFFRIEKASTLPPPPFVLFCGIKQGSN
jgi:hypothetical protein